jgi:hypothetical protein
MQIVHDPADTIAKARWRKGAMDGPTGCNLFNPTNPTNQTNLTNLLRFRPSCLTRPPPERP